MQTTVPALTELTHIAMSLDALNCGALLVERNGIIVHVNKRVCDMTGRSRESLVGTSLDRMYEPGPKRMAVQGMLHDFDHAREAEFIVPAVDGTELPVMVSARPAGHVGMLCEYAVVTLVDISRQKQAEEDLKEQNREITELSDRVIRQALVLREHAHNLEERVRERTRELHEAHMQTIYMLAIASEAKDGDTGKHVRRMQKLSELIGNEMGLTTTQAEQLGYSAVLHDVGKMHTPDRVLKKPGPLNDGERALMEAHTLAGERILKPSEFFRQASLVARNHHENWDGSGYPDRLAGNNIPYEARIVHLADVYDALVHKRVYKPAWSHEEAVEQILRARAAMFDPDVVDAFKRLNRDGELERLRDSFAE